MERIERIRSVSWIVGGWEDLNRNVFRYDLTGIVFWVGVNRLDLYHGPAGGGETRDGTAGIKVCF